MTDRVKFLRAIREQSDDDTARLVFADWLDENAESDRDTATAEFIRVSCLGRNVQSGKMPPLAYKWLAEHWQRLVPTVLSRHVVLYVREGPSSTWDHAPFRSVRFGRSVRVEMKLPACPGSGLLLWFTALLEFDRGFMKNVVLRSAYQAGHLVDALAVDQPFGRLHVLDGSTTVRMDLWSRSWGQSDSNPGVERARCD